MENSQVSKRRGFAFVLAVCGAAVSTVALVECAARLTPAQEEAVAQWKQACDGGDLKACTSLGHQYAGGASGPPIDARQAVELYKKACKGGEAGGCFFLAAAYQVGNLGLARDITQSVALWKQACDSGSDSSATAGCADLGAAYEHAAGGLSRDLDQAAALYKKACDGGFPGACGEFRRLKQSQ